MERKTKKNEEEKKKMKRKDRGVGVGVGGEWGGEKVVTGRERRKEKNKNRNNLKRCEWIRKLRYKRYLNLRTKLNSKLSIKINFR